MNGYRFLLYIIFTLFTIPLYGQTGYLQNNRIDLRRESPEIVAPLTTFTVIHGSAKSEEAELALLSAILRQTDTLYYFQEIDCASAYFFNRYLESGDSAILKQQIINYGKRVSQEGSWETYDRWEKLRELSKGKTIRVYGIDVLINYRNYFNLLSEIAEDTWIGWKYVDKELFPISDERLCEQFAHLTAFYDDDQEKLTEGVKDVDLFAVVMSDLKILSLIKR